MSKILERIINSENDKRLVLINSRAARTMLMGSDWTNLMIGVRWAWHLPLETSILGNPRFFVGVCAGTDNVIGDGSADHALGAHYAGGSATSLTYTGSPNDILSAPGGNACLVGTKRIGTTDTNASMHSVQTQVYGHAGGAAGPTRHSIFFLEIQKGSPNYQLTALIANASPFGGGGVTLPQFIGCMDITISNIPSFLSGQGYALSLAASIAVDEATDGYFDSVCLYWNKASAALEISDVAVARY